MWLTASVAVVGGGIVGSAAALFLAESGENVVVLERAAGPTQASVRNAGGVRAQCRSRTERRLALASIELWRDLAARTGVDFEYHQGGNIRVALTEPTLAALAAEAVEEAEDGLTTEVWGRAELRRRAPHVSPRFVGAKYCATDGHANPILATWMVVNAAKAAGVRYVGDAEVTQLDLDGGRVRGLRATAGGEALRVDAATVVHAAGPWTAALAATIGVRLPLTPARNAMLVSQGAPPLLPEFVSSHELGIYLRQARAGQVHVGGVFTVDGTFDQRVGHDEISRLARAVEIVPGLARLRILRSWAGTLDLTPDHLPVLGTPSGVDGYLVAAGFNGHGFCLAPAIGRTVAELVTGGPTAVDVAPLHPDRFAAC